MIYFWAVLGIIGTGFVSWGVTRWFIDFALCHKLIDIPNERSSHMRPTARGGGISFVVAFSAAACVLAILGVVSAPQIVAIAGGLVIALIGFCDDSLNLSPLPRFCVQICIASLFVYSLTPLSPVRFGLAINVTSNTVAVLTTIGLTWLINLTNFMDGIDGIASVETVTTALTCCMLLIWKQHFDGIGLLFALLASSVGGFLIWNWFPASVFMGDVGSGYLGYILGVLALIAVRSGRLRIWTVGILLGVFILDASWTLLRRILRADIWHRPHRTHAFQKAAMRWGHRNTALGVAVINIFWLAPWAALAETSNYGGFWLLLIAWLPIVGMICLLRAGVSDRCDAQVRPATRIPTQPLTHFRSALYLPAQDRRVP